MVCVTVVGLRVPSCYHYLRPSHRLSLIGRLFRTWSRRHFLPIGSSYTPPKHKSLLALAVSV